MLCFTPASSADKFSSEVFKLSPHVTPLQFFDVRTKKPTQRAEEATGLFFCFIGNTVKF